ncbi:hypothetical protein niasHT_032997 [Heterodera trifolii]|uniref:Uncharacterized protein n=1 Tax=Heterodera trifolii TaxID=157864 RepID=A0ABD2ILH0_9BILA
MADQSSNRIIAYLKRQKQQKEDLIRWFEDEDAKRSELLEAQENEIKALKRDNEKKEDEFKKLKEHLQKAEEAEEMRKLAQNAFVAARKSAKKAADRWSVRGTSPTASSLSSRRSSFGSLSSVSRKSAEPSAKKAPTLGHFVSEMRRLFDERRDSGFDPRTFEELEQYNDNNNGQKLSLLDELGPYSNDKPGEELEQYSNDKPGEELEQYSNDKPGEELEQYSSNSGWVQQQQGEKTLFDELRETEEKQNSNESNNSEDELEQYYDTYTEFTGPATTFSSDFK